MVGLHGKVFLMEASNRGKEGEIRMLQVEGSCHDLVGPCTEDRTKKGKDKIKT